MPALSAQPPGAIRRLDARLINQIAAGEVVVRPASAVKELIENSLDAGATRIEIAVEEGAGSFTIRDDGCGMSAEDARLAVERYATSKIRELDDLSRLTTRGFRGEALAAISAVSRFELMTRRAEEQAGVVLKCDGGAEPRVHEAGLPPGTTIAVRDLFFNTPARLKFLRNPVAEWGHIAREATRQALTRPDVGFALRWRGKPFLTLPPGQTLRERFAALVPSDVAGNLLDVEWTLHEVRVHGCIASPRSTRRDRRHQFFFANGRPIVSRPLTFALQEAYKGLIMTQQYPIAALFIELDGGEIDANVHPTKEEVRFRNEQLVAGAVHRAALEALRKAELAPQIQLAAPGQSFARHGVAPGERSPSIGAPPPRAAASAGGGEAPAAPPDFFRAEPRPRAQPSVHGEQREFVSAAAPARAPDPLADYPDEQAAQEMTLIERLRRAPAPPRALAQIEETYILADAPGVGLLMLDQHAVHEKLLYLRHRRRAERRETQPLLVPVSYEASPSERAALEALAPLLTEEGFETEHFGGNTFLVQSVPVAFERVNVQALLRDALGELGDGDPAKELETLRHKIAAMAACRAAVKSGDRLGMGEMQSLLDRMVAESEALRCPHGRPTVLLLTRDQLDRQFGRLG